MLMMCHVVLGLTFRRKGMPSLVIEILTIGAGRVNGSINIFLILKVVNKKKTELQSCFHSNIVLFMF